jgi:hypothetical protein
MIENATKSSYSIYVQSLKELVSHYSTNMELGILLHDNGDAAV